MKIGYEACWKLIRSGRNPIHCRRPKGHDGPCAPLVRPKPPQGAKA